MNREPMQCPARPGAEEIFVFDSPEKKPEEGGLPC